MNDTPPDPVPARLSVWRILAVALGLLAVVGLLAGLLEAVAEVRNGGMMQTVVLPTGERLQLLSVTYGDKGTFTTKKPWQKLLRRILPARFQNLLPPPITIDGYVTSSGPNGLRMIVLATPPPPGRVWSSLNFQTQDETGFRYPALGTNGYMMMGPTNNQTIYSLEPVAYPRRQKEFLLVASTFAGLDVATFKIRNPAAGPFPEWQ